MDNEQDRIRLMRAMGTEPAIETHESRIERTNRKGMPHWDELELEADGWVLNDDEFWRDDFTDNYVYERELPEPVEHWPMFDPWENASDDYAVLCWLRSKFGDFPSRYGLSCELQWGYHVGNYARAALKVLDDE